MARDPATQRYAALNRKARHDYFIEDTLEAGMILLGSEVKSLRAGQASIAEAFAAQKDGELYLFNAHIPEYSGANQFNHQPRRPRQLLLKQRERARLFGQLERQGMTLIPLSIYFTPRGIAKLELGLAKGKRKVDKRDSVKERDWQRDKARLLRDTNR
ncbi:MAG TPA: SsrA-binding protein SmpB [Dongiaceae bacterium]|jgi:SsrA-binding protein|nr:SsrA-binding protein SmpB [Dongiaceae bacterium]